jgi:hypothetical protein
MPIARAALVAAGLVLLAVIGRAGAAGVLGSSDLPRGNLALQGVEEARLGWFSSLASNVEAITKLRRRSLTSSMALPPRGVADCVKLHTQTTLQSDPTEECPVAAC